MPKLINRPTAIVATGTMPKEISEFVGQANTGNAAMSIAKMESPAGWSEQGQTPAFAETSIVLRGSLRVEVSDGTIYNVAAGQAIECTPGEWVRYSTPGNEGASYISVCEPAFTEAGANRDPV
jgi:quercetin dioxygenase-like cupin family protein